MMRQQLLPKAVTLVLLGGGTGCEHDTECDDGLVCFAVTARCAQARRAGGDCGGGVKPDCLSDLLGDPGRLVLRGQIAAWPKEVLLALVHPQSLATFTG
jgi:hypothetical protein